MSILTNTDSTNNLRLATELSQEFLVRNYEWNFAGDRRIPTEEEILTGLQALKDTTPDGHFQAQGRLVVINTEGHIDVYLHLGEIE